jgi:N-acetylglucosamine-6-phosphate deacetylase
MSKPTALTGARIFDGENWHDDAALIVAGSQVSAIVARSAVPADAQIVELGGGLLAPGFVDLQVNGGGGVMLNDHRTADAIGTICAAHAPFGTTALLATLITDTPEITAEAVEAGAEAARRQIPGFLGLHLEGPHLSLKRKGAHDPQLIRPMTGADQAALIAARHRVPVLLSTVATESVTPEQMTALSKAGIIVSLGHTDTTQVTARLAADAGATVVTHLFNAMSQIGNREAGLAGATLDDGRLWAGLIADGIHVDPVTIGIAMRSKREDARIFLVTDAMSTIGTDLKSFTLNGRVIRRENGRLTLEDGTLAGADLDMISAVRFMHEVIGLGVEEALRMASLYPAQAVNMADRYGRLGKGSRADIVHLSDGLDMRGVWIGGDKVFAAN